MSIHIKASFLIIFLALGLTHVYPTDIYPLFLERESGSLLEGYFTPPSCKDSPIIFAIQGSSCQSIFTWHRNLSDQAQSLGFGIITLEKEGISHNAIDPLIYQQTNCLEDREKDHALCLNNMEDICPGWEGKVIFWGESEGGMIAARLGGRTMNTAAVLLFGAGGGMQPKEEVKWALQHRQKLMEEDENNIQKYLDCVDEQINQMINDPTPSKCFLGNTYKWWGSFLSEEELVMSLAGCSIPIYLVHGEEDIQIPIQSADLASEKLSLTNPLTYLRLKGYGHNLDTTAVQDAAYEWIQVILSENADLDKTLVAEKEHFPLVQINDFQIDRIGHVFSRGKKNEEENRGRIYTSGKYDKDSEGNEKRSLDVGVEHKIGDRLNIHVKAGASDSRDKKGHSKAEVHAELKGSLDY